LERWRPLEVAAMSERGGALLRWQPMSERGGDLSLVVM
jgi:hypothetical protein